MKRKSYNTEMEFSTKTLFIPKNKKALVFVSLFFIFNLFQQYGRREDYPFTYFGMYKEGRLETKSFYQFKIYYQSSKDTQKRIDIASFEMDHYYLKKKLDALLLNQTYLPNNDPLAAAQGIQENKQDDLNLLFIKDIIPQLKKKNLSLEDSYLFLQINYWDDLNPSNSKNPSLVREYHRISVENLLKGQSL